MLGDLIAETDTTEEGEASEVTKEELTQEVKKSVEEAVKPISDRLDKLEKGGEDSTTSLNERLDKLEKAEAEPKPETPDVAEVVKTAIAEAIAPINERIEKIEKARGFSNRQAEDTSVQKSNDDFWGGMF